MNLFKTLTGPSTVGMPRVIRNGGLLTGFVGFLFIGFLNAYCNITMVRCSRILGNREDVVSVRGGCGGKFCFPLGHASLAESGEIWQVRATSRIS
ncbi:proton-coupled amino acid transporter 4 [Elysia marginata]|uniref:Proton-coupled amino acid transporter 4 n=1 Tax=Elysia marginata TaxID=1093978 RepID=A0AAV4FSB3_9GAST|nr:proton-coupled amino acid transporter 4 [Elysia marginata]